MSQDSKDTEVCRKQGLHFQKLQCNAKMLSQCGDKLKGKNCWLKKYLWIFRHLKSLFQSSFRGRMWAGARGWVLTECWPVTRCESGAKTLVKQHRYTMCVVWSTAALCLCLPSTHISGWLGPFSRRWRCDDDSFSEVADVNSRSGGLTDVLVMINESDASSTPTWEFLLLLW